MTKRSEVDVSRIVKQALSVETGFDIADLLRVRLGAERKAALEKNLAFLDALAKPKVDPYAANRGIEEWLMAKRGAQAGR